MCDEAISCPARRLLRSARNDKNATALSANRRLAEAALARLSASKRAFREFGQEMPLIVFAMDAGHNP